MTNATFHFTLPSITCISCSHSIEHGLKHYQQKNTWLKDYFIDLTTKRLTVTVDDSKQLTPMNYSELLSEAVEDTGFRCIPLDLDNAILINKPIEEHTQTRSPGRKIINFLNSHWFQGLVGTLLGFSLLAASLLTGGLPVVAMVVVGAVSTLITLWLGYSSYKDAFIKLWKAKTLTMDSLFTISTLTVIVVSTLAFFVPWLPMMFEAGLLVFGFRHVGLAIEETIKRKIEVDKRFQHRLPRQVTLYVDDGQTEKAALGVIQANDTLIIEPGEIIPVDGICLTESTLIYETIKTGSPLPRHVNQGERVISGMRLAEDSRALKLQATAAARDSYLAKLDKTIEQAQHEKAPIEEVASRILQYFIPGVIIFAILAGIGVGLFFTPALAIKCAVSVLVSACPCTLGLIVPLAVKIGLQKAAESGVEIKSSKKIQDAANVDAIVCDLHGTLTLGVPVVADIKLFRSEIDAQTLMTYVTSLEQKSKHPVAKAICEYAKAKNVLPLNEADYTIDSSHHSGIQGMVKGKAVIVGNEKMMRDAGIVTAHLAKKIKLTAGETIIYLAYNNKLAGYLIVKDPLRADAQQTISALKKLGKKVYICTGADEQTAHRYARLLGIPKRHVAASHVGMAEKDNSNNAKVDFIGALQAKKLKVAMLGDADNDALALAKSDFGIAVQSNAGSEITQQQASAIIRSHSLRPVANLFKVAQQTVSTIKQNLTLSLSYNATALLVTTGLLVLFGFALNPGVGVALMILQTSLILANTYRLKTKSLGQHDEGLKARTPAKEDSYHSFKQSMQFNKSLEANLTDIKVNKCLLSAPAKTLIPLQPEGEKLRLSV